MDKEEFRCIECPICEQLEDRLKYVDNNTEFQFNHYSCCKVDGDFFTCGYCEDAWQENKFNQRQGKRNTGRRYRRYIKKKKFNKLKEEILSQNKQYFSPILLNFFSTDANYFYRKHNSRESKYTKMVYNRKIRRYKDKIPKGHTCYRLFSWWYW